MIPSYFLNVLAIYKFKIVNQKGLEGWPNLFHFENLRSLKGYECNLSCFSISLYR